MVRRTFAEWSAAESNRGQRDSVPSVVQSDSPNLVEVAGRAKELPANLQSPALELTEPELERAVLIFERSLTFLRKLLPATPVLVVYVPSPLSSYRLLSAVTLLTTRMIEDMTVRGMAKAFEDQRSSQGSGARRRGRLRRGRNRATAYGAWACSLGGDENDPLMKAYLSTFTRALEGLGWADGRNVRMDLRRREPKWSGVEFMAAWRRAIELSLGDEDTAELNSIAQSRTETASRVERARILLLRWHSNRSLLGRENSTGKRFGEARDWRGTFGVTGPIPGGRDHAISRLRQQSHGKSKTNPTALGNRNCTRLRGQGIMEPELIHDGGRRIIAPILGWQDRGPIDMAPPAQVPSRWHRVDPCRR
jgi:hypothetical protein